MKKIKLSILGFLLFVCVGVIFVHHAGPLTAQAANERIAVTYDSSNLTIEISKLNVKLNNWNPVGYELYIYGKFSTASGYVYSINLTTGSRSYLSDDSDFCIELPGYPTFSIDWKNSYSGYSFISGESYTLYLSLVTLEYDMYSEWFSIHSNTDVYTFLYDISPPVFNALPTYTNSATTVQASDYSGISRLYYKKDNGAYNYTTSASYTVNAALENNGCWYFYAIDNNGATSEVVSFVMDTVSPTVSKQSDFSNQEIQFDASDNNPLTLYYRKNSIGAYSSSANTTLKITASTNNAGQWECYAVDAAGNTSSIAYSIIDVTALELSTTNTFSSGTAGLNSGATTVSNDLGYTNQSVSFSYQSGSSTNAGIKTRTLNESPYDGTTISAEGAYSLVITDFADNVRTVSFVIDKQAQKLTTTNTFSNSAVDLNSGATTVSNDLGYTNQSVIFDFETQTTTNAGISTRTLNGETYDGSTISAEGIYSLVVTDHAGNKRTVYFVIDKQALELTTTNTFSNDTEGLSSGATSVTNNLGYTNQNVYFSAKAQTSTNAGIKTRTLNGEDYDNNTITNEGIYTLVVTDIAGNVRTVSFVIDKQALKLTTTNAFSNAATGLNSGATSITNDLGYTNQSVYFGTEAQTSTNAGIKTRTLNGEDYDNNTITAEGSYTLLITDIAGNVRTVSFVIDKQALKLTTTNTFSNGAASLSSGATTITNNLGYTNQNVSFSIEAQTTTNAGISSRALNGSTYDGTAISVEGTYTLVITDIAGNVRTVSFVIDKQALKLTTTNTFSSDATGLSSGATSITNDLGYTNQSVYFGTETQTTTNAGVKSRTLNGNDYDNNTITAEGTYTLVITDIADNVRTITFVIDKQALKLNTDNTFSQGIESLSIGAVNAINDLGYTNQSINFSIEAQTTTNAGISSRTLNGSTYDGTTISAEGAYTLIITDIAGNLRTITFVVDKQALKLTTTNTFSNGAASLGSGAATITNDLGYTNQSINFSIEAQTTTNAGISTRTLNGNAYNGATISAEGTYSLVITDLAGNVRTVTFVIDKQALKLTTMNTFSNGATGLDSGATTITNDLGYTNQNVSFSIEAQTNYNAGISSRTLNGSTYDGTAISAEGTYTLIITDIAGNVRTIKFTIDKTLITNYSAVQSNYKIGQWWEATLKSYFDTQSGKYSFVSEQDMIDFCWSMEIAKRVEFTNGNWIYISINNQSAQQNYSSEDALRLAITYYATQMHGEKKSIGSSLNTIERPMRRGAEKSCGGIIYWEWFLDESIMYDNPVMHSELVGDYYLLRGSFTFERMDKNKVAPYNNVTAKYIANDLQLVDGKIFSLNYGIAFSNNLSIEDYKQGYYLITESDIAGNTFSYVVYIDRTAPTFYATGVADGEQEIVLNSADIALRNKYYFYTVKDIVINDGLDGKWNTLEISGGKLGLIRYGYYDSMPYLNMDTSGKGEFTIRLYDRAGNVLEFIIVIAGQTPYASYNGLTSSNKVDISVYRGESFNAIVDLYIVKLKLNGTSSRLDEDDEGTPINVLSMEYVILTGGKYQIFILDIFGVWIELEPFFFEKGLPSATIKGTANNGVTNQQVSFTFETSFVFSVYLDGNYFTEYNTTIDNLLGQRTITFRNNAAFDGTYKILIVNGLDEDFFIEYYFRLKCSAPSFEIYTSEGTALNANTSTNKSIKLDWTEAGAVMYYKRDNGIERRYSQNEVLSESGEYSFRIVDTLGNEAKFEMFIKKEILYEILGNYNIVDGWLVSNQTLQIKQGEKLSEYRIESEVALANDTLLNADGEYIITMIDLYDNTVSLKILIKKTAPRAELIGVQNNGVTKDAVTVKIMDNDVIAQLYDASNSKLIGIYTSEDIIKTHGSWRLVISDIAGNQTIFEFSIKNKINATVNVPFGAITTEYVKITFNESVTQTVTLNGEQFVSDTYYSKPGVYYIYAEDYLGNFFEYSFEIILPKSNYFSLVLENEVLLITHNDERIDAPLIEGVLIFDKDGKYTVLMQNSYGEQFSFEIIIDSVPPIAVFEGIDISVETSVKSDIIIKSVTKNAKYTLYKDGKELNYRLGQAITGAGHYKLVLIDDVGNITEYEFTRIYTLNTLSIVVIAIGGSIAAAFMFALAHKRRHLGIR